MSWDGQQRHGKGGQRETDSATANYCTTEQTAKHSSLTNMSQQHARLCILQ